MVFKLDPILKHIPCYKQKTQHQLFSHFYRLELFQSINSVIENRTYLLPQLAIFCNLSQKCGSIFQICQLSKNHKESIGVRGSKTRHKSGPIRKPDCSFGLKMSINNNGKIPGIKTTISTTEEKSHKETKTIQNKSSR